MTTDEKTKEDADRLLRDEHEARTRAAQLDVLLALQNVAKAELAKGPGISSNAWRELFDAVAAVLGDEPMAQAAPVVGRQPMVIPPGFKHPIPAKGGATPTRPDQPVLVDGDIRKRGDVAAEIERVKRGGK
jgi:hypothetical protein